MSPPKGRGRLSRSWELCPLSDFESSSGDLGLAPAGWRERERPGASREPSLTRASPDPSLLGSDEGFLQQQEATCRADPRHVVTARVPVMLCFRSKKEGVPEASSDPEEAQSCRHGYVEGHLAWEWGFWGRARDGTARPQAVALARARPRRPVAGREPPPGLPGSIRAREAGCCTNPQRCKQAASAQRSCGRA